VRKPEDVQASFCATLVDEWVRSGLRAAMIAPGSRSTPMAVALTANPAVTVSVFLDERSAAFAALPAFFCVVHGGGEWTVVRKPHASWTHSYASVEELSRADAGPDAEEILRRSGLAPTGE